MEQKLFTIQEYLYRNEKELADTVYLRQSLDWEWKEYTWKEVMMQARKIASFLKSLGLKEGDRVSILSRNCAEWFIADFGIALAGLINVPFFTTLSKDNIRYICEHAEVKLIFLGRLDNARDLDQGIPSDVIRCDMGYYINTTVQHKWVDIQQSFEPLKENFIPKLSDTFTLIYTSGTTGAPKGVIVTHEMCAHLLEVIIDVAERGSTSYYDGARYLSYLPLAHVFERVVIEIGSVVGGKRISVSFIDTPETFIEDARNVRPTVFIAVPRIWMTLQNGILRRINQQRIDFILKIPFFRSLFKRRVRKALGLNDAICASGAAPLSKSLMEWWRKLGVVILEGYGLTETLAITAINPGFNPLLGSVGMSIKGVDVKLSEESELLVKSATNTIGYYKDPEATAKLYTEDGYLRTGDKAKIDENGHIYIIGRIKDTFKTDKGEFVDPVPIENLFQSNEYIAQMCLIGLNLVQPVLVVVLDRTQEESRETIEQSLIAYLDKVNESLTTYQKISHIFIARDEWTVDTKFVTPTLKTKRNEVASFYTDKVKQGLVKSKKIIWE